MRSLFFFLSLLLSFTTYSQITIEANTLPEVGDVLEYQNFAAFEDTLAYQQNGENISWEIGRVGLTGNSQEAYPDIANSPLADSFPDANMLLNLGPFEAAAIRRPNSIDIIGISIGGFGDFGIDAAVNFANNYTLRQTPLTYGSQYDDDFEVVITIPADEIPFLDSLDLGALGGVVEAIRVTSIVSKSEEVVGWGNLSLWNENIEVLKVEQIDNSETVIEAGVNLGGFIFWFDIADFLGGTMGDGFAGAQSTLTHKFLAADLKTSVIEFTENRFQDELGVNILTVTGRVSGDIMSNTENLTFEDGGISLFSDMITLSSTNDDLNNDLHLEVLDFEGRKVLSIPAHKLGRRIDVSGLQAGQYILRVRSEKNSYLTKMTLIR